MQEEVENRTLTLVVSGTKFTGRLLKAAISKYMAHCKEKKLQKQRSRDAPVVPHGKQTVKQLVGQNQGISNIEITDPSIKEFEKIARKYGVDYAVKKDRSSSPPKYLIFSKAVTPMRLTALFTGTPAKRSRRPRKKYARLCWQNSVSSKRWSKCRGGPHQAKGAGTMKSSLTSKARFAEPALFSDWGCLLPTSERHGEWHKGRMLQKSFFRWLRFCLGRCKVSGQACIHWTCW